MRIVYFRLKGYIKVMNGMGLQEVVIPFSTFKNRIVLVQGENGCAKSTIISALSPNVDSSDSFRTDVFIDDFGNRQIVEYPGEKEIHYIDTSSGYEDYYRILIQSNVDESKTRRTSKAYISKNGEELNPTGNISSFKEIRDTLLGIDPVYLDLSSISSENRGIVDMIPSERRKYMASYIGSLDTYNNIFKILSKKVTSLRSYMNTINTKLYELGDGNELRLRLAKLESELKRLQESRDRCLSDLSKAKTIADITDPEGKIQDTYISISNRLTDLNSQIEKVNKDIESAYIVTKVGTRQDVERIYESLSNNIETNKATVESNSTMLPSLIKLNEVVIEKINSDQSILDGLTTERLPINIEQTIKGLNEEINLYKKYLSKNDIEVICSTSVNELRELHNTLEQILNEVNVARDIGNEKLFNASVAYVLGTPDSKKLEKVIAKSHQKLVDHSAGMAKLKIRLEDLQEKAKLVEEAKSMRPKQCKIDNCSYISKYVEMAQQHDFSLEIEDCMVVIDNAEKIRKSYQNALDQLELMRDIVKHLEIVQVLISSKKSIIKKIKPISNQLLDAKQLKNSLCNHYSFPEFSLVESLIEKSQIYSEMTQMKDQVSNLTKQLEKYKQDKNLIETLTKSIEKNKKECNERAQEIKRIHEQSKTLTKAIESMMEQKGVFEKVIALYSDYDMLIGQKEELKKEFNQVKDKIKLVHQQVESVQKFSAELKSLEEVIRPVTDEITRLKYSLANMIGYQEELKDSSNQYDKLSFIRNACSPGNGKGIQSEYIKRYMNDIIIDCNKMLRYMFGGAIQLEVPVINEKQFSIPFIGPNGIVVPDISNGSTAQKCMMGLVFSCIAMMKSSLKYNIPRFDEIDGGLDPQNRITFINVLNQILDFMHCDQCIICSHNTEFDTQSTTRLVCSRHGIKIEQ